MRHSPDRDRDRSSDSSDDSEDGYDSEDLPKLKPFQRFWLKGEALKYALETHYEEFFEKNADDPKEGSAFAQEAANDMMKTFGVFGPWGTDSKPLDERSDYVPSEDEEEEDQVRLMLFILFASFPQCFSFVGT